MILQYLFLQYDKRKGPSFSSRFMKALGTAFMGSPADKGLGHLRQDLQNTYYYIQADRKLPKGDAALKQWQMQSIQVSEYRQVEAPQVALATAMCVFALCAVCVALASPFNGSLKRTVGLGEGGALSRWADRTFSDESPDVMTYEACLAIDDRISKGEITAAEIPDFQGKRRQCQQLLINKEAGR